MGKRLHVVKRQEEYGSYETFNWKWEEFHSFLDLVGCYCCGETYDDRFDCLAESYKFALDALKSYQKSGEKSKKFKALLEENYITEEELLECVEVLGGLDHVIEAMQTFYKERDKKSMYIQFVAW